jgi:PKHD-type hydroxylase
MDYQIIPVFEPDQAARLLAALKTHPFVDGKATASGIARDVKNNLQVERSGDSLAELDQWVTSSLCANSTFQAFAFPRRLRAPIFSRYEPGMNYGAHVDGAIMNDNGSLLRADLAVTLFLSPPESYDGGELVIELAYGEEEIKLAAGEAVVYSADTVHRVAEVTRGVRMAAVTWVQTAVHDSKMRTVLYDLFLALQKVEANEDPKLLLSKSYNNLLRMNSEF